MLTLFVKGHPSLLRGVQQKSAADGVVHLFNIEDCIQQLLVAFSS